MFQSLTRDSNHSNADRFHCAPHGSWFQSLTRDSNHSNIVELIGDVDQRSFNPSRGIAIIQTDRFTFTKSLMIRFQSLTRDSNHSNPLSRAARSHSAWFQSLTRDSNHSNSEVLAVKVAPASFNPSRGIAIIQTRSGCLGRADLSRFNPSRGIAIIQTRQGRGNAHS